MPIPGLSRLRWRDAGFLAAGVGLGLLAGGYLFADVQPRSFLAVRECGSCLSANDLAGLVGAVVMQRAPGLLPEKVIETDKTVAIRWIPPWKGLQHWVIIPKRDIRNTGTLAEGDEAYLADSYAVIGKLIRDNDLHDYVVLTRGPKAQAVTYLHFHLVSPSQSLNQALGETPLPSKP